MRRVFSVLAAAALLNAGVFPSAQAAFYGLPKGLKGQVVRMAFAQPTLAPMAHTRFCMQYPPECQVRRIAFRGKAIALNEERWSQLVRVNREVNRSIMPQRNTGGVSEEEWLVSPKAGDCNDFAVTKRHQLLAQGWPSSSLLLAEVMTGRGEHHLVLVVRVHEGDLVLDNLNANIRPWSTARYKWARVQSPKHPKYWSTVTTSAAKHYASLRL